MKHTLSNSQIARILDQHNALHYNENGRIIALTPYTTRNGQSGYEAEDLTGSTLKEVLWWLGY